MFAEENNFDEDSKQVTIFNKIENGIKIIEEGMEKQFTHGYIYQKSAKSLADIVLQVLKMYQIEFEIKSNINNNLQVPTIVLNVCFYQNLSNNMEWKYKLLIKQKSFQKHL